jgi:hypothetical protein
MPNIDPRIELIATELEKLGSQIERAHTDQRLLTDWFGWNHPALNRKSLADFSLRLAKQIRESSPAALGGLSDEISTKLADIPRRISTIAGQVGHFFNGNGPQAIPAYLATLQSIANDLEPILGEALRSDAIDLPKEVLRRLRAAKKTLSSFEGQLDSLSETIKIISDAQSAAEELPSTLQDLQSAKKQVETARLSAERAALNSTEGADKIDQLLKQVKANHAQSEKLVANIDEAYRIVTTKGLAAAFAQRSRTLAISMWVWVAVLMAALATGGYFASDHESHLATSLGRADYRAS